MLFQSPIHWYIQRMGLFLASITKEMNIEKYGTDLIPQQQQNWQGRPEWFFNREHTDTYEQWYEGRYKRAEVRQKKVMEQLVSADKRIGTLLEFGCGTTRFTRWWKEIGIQATGGDISPLMLSQAR